MSEQERLCVEEQEEDVLRELRLFLRNLTERLMVDRRFKAFTKPVDIEEVNRFCLSHLYLEAGQTPQRRTCWKPNYMHTCLMTAILRNVWNKEFVILL